MDLRPMLVRLLAAGGPGMPPVEVCGGGYRPQVIGFAGEDLANVEDVRFARVPAHTAVGVEVGDRHHRFGLRTEVPVEVPAGAGVLIPAGALRLHGSRARAATGGAARAAYTVGPLPGWPA